MKALTFDINAKYLRERRWDIVSKKLGNIVDEDLQKFAVEYLTLVMSGLGSLPRNQDGSLSNGMITFTIGPGQTASWTCNIDNDLKLSENDEEN